MNESEIKKNLKASNTKQLMKIAEKNNIALDKNLSIKQMRKILLIGILEQQVAKETDDGIAHAESDTVSGGAPMTEDERAAADAAAEEAAEAEAEAKQWSMLQKYLDGPLTSVQVQFLDKMANDIQKIKTAIPPFTVEKLEATVKEWISSLEDLV